MHLALGYRWTLTTPGFHLERAFQELGHQVSYVGLPAATRPGYDGAVSIDTILTSNEPGPNFYLWVDPAGRYFPQDIDRLAIPTACYLIDVHLGQWRIEAARFFDVVFIAQKDYVDEFRRAVGHDQVYWLPLAAATDVHRQHDLPRQYDVGFVGNIAQAHRQTARARRLRLLSQRFQTNDFYQRYTPEEVGYIYSQSRLVFNNSIAGDVTMRVFEGAACGALVLTDMIKNGLADLFRPDQELIVFRDDEDLLTKIEYYLTHEDERRDIALAGQRRIQAEHTYTHRAEAILRIIGEPGLERCAPMRRAAAAEREAARRAVLTHLHMLDAIFDEARSAGYPAWQRIQLAWPCLMRRLLT